MTLRSGHGKGKGVPRIEVMPADELPDPVPAPVAPPTPALIFAPDGKIADSATAKALGAKGGRTKAARRQALKGLGLAKLPETADFHPYWRVSEEFIQEKLADLAMQCGGFVGPGPTSMIVTAARQYAASLYLYDLAMNMGGPSSAKLFHDASARGNDSRQNLMAAFEMGVREAKARVESNESSGIDAFEAALKEQNRSSEDESSE